MGYSIITFDEASFRLVPVYKRVWFFRGEKPKGIFFWSNKKLNIFGALIDGKKLFHEFYAELNSFTYRSFLYSLTKRLSKKKKYLFLLDNASYHKSSRIREFLSEHKNIITKYFPPYCPELNPTETCWKTVRHDVTNSTYFYSIEDMQVEIDNFLKKHIFMLKISNYLCR